MADEPEEPSKGNDPINAGHGFDDYEVVSKGFRTDSLLSESTRKAFESMAKGLGIAKTASAQEAYEKVLGTAAKFQSISPADYEVPVLVNPSNLVAENTADMRESMTAMVEFMGKLVELTDQNIRIARQAQEDTSKTAKFTKTATVVTIVIAAAALIVAVAALVVAVVHP